jgi:hypothetical protein
MAAAARPYWTGFLKLSLVTIAVRLYSATTEKERVHFHRIHEPSGERVRYQNVVPGLGPVDSSEIVKGYEYQKGRYVTVEPDDLEKLRLETTEDWWRTSRSWYGWTIIGNRRWRDLGGSDGKRAIRQRAGIDGCVLARRQLPVSGPNLSL